MTTTTIPTVMTTVTTITMVSAIPAMMATVMPTIVMTAVILIAKRHYGRRIAIIAWRWTVISYWLTVINGIAVINRLARVNGCWIIDHRRRVTITTNIYA